MLSNFPFAIPTHSPSLLLGSFLAQTALTAFPPFSHLCSPPFPFFNDVINFLVSNPKPGKIIYNFTLFLHLTTVITQAANKVTDHIAL